MSAGKAPGSTSGFAPAATASAICPRTVSAKRRFAIGPERRRLVQRAAELVAGDRAPPTSPRRRRRGSRARRCARCRSSTGRSCTSPRPSASRRRRRGWRRRARSPGPCRRAPARSPTKVPAAARSISWPPRTLPVKLMKSKARPRISSRGGRVVEEDVGEQPLRQVREGLRQPLAGERGLARVLQHHRVAGDQRRDDGVDRGQERVVPGRDDEDDAERLAGQVRGGSGRCPR